MTEIFDQIAGWMPAMLKATGVTMQLTVTSVLTAMVLGIFVALARISTKKILSRLAAAYIFVFRGSPLLIQLFIIYFGLPQIIPGFDLGSRFMAAYVAFSLNITAYLAEIFRAAIQSIDKGQMEASRSLGLTYGQAMRLVIIPQSYRRMIPPVCNEFLMVMKDTSLVCIIAVVELTYQTKMIATASASMLAYIPALIIYLILTAIFTIIFNRLEKKFSVYE